MPRWLGRALQLTTEWPPREAFCGSRQQLRTWLADHHHQDQSPLGVGPFQRQLSPTAGPLSATATPEVLRMEGGRSHSPDIVSFRKDTGAGKNTN